MRRGRLVRVSFAVVIVAASLAIAAPPASGVVPGAPGLIAFVSHGRDSIKPSIYVTPADDSWASIRVPTTVRPQEERIAWTPGGEWITYAAADGIRAVRPDGTGSRIVLSNEAGSGSAEGRLGSPAWGPDGDQLAFVTGGGLHVKDVTADDAPTRISGVAREPDWSPDGTRLAYVFDDASIRASDPDGTDTVDLLPAGWCGTTTCSVYSVSWKPDGGSLAFEGGGGSFGYGIWIVSVGGGDPVSVIAGASSPAWSPDGTRLTFARRGHIWTVNLDGSGAVDITRGERSTCCSDYEDGYPAWQGSSLTIAVSRRAIDLGDRVSITVHLVPWAEATNRVVRVFMHEVGAKQVLMTRSSVSPSSGDLTLEAGPTRNAAIWATWTGDEGHASARSLTASVGVRAQVEGSMRGGYGREGTYRLYHRSQEPIFLVRVVPPKSGQRVDVSLYRRKHGSWRFMAGDRFRLDDRSRLGVIMTGWPLGRYRIRAWYRGDEANLGARSSFSYFRITA